MVDDRKEWTGESLMEKLKYVTGQERIERILRNEEDTCPMVTTNLRYQ